MKKFIEELLQEVRYAHSELDGAYLDELQPEINKASAEHPTNPAIVKMLELVDEARRFIPLASDMMDYDRALMQGATYA